MQNTNYGKDGYSSQKNITIQIFRVIACIMVLLTHMRSLVPMTPIANYIDFGGFGVGVFFIISGYLAFNSSDLAEGRILTYYRKRALRILPLFYIVIFIWWILRGKVFYDMPEDPSGLYWLNYVLLIFKSYPNSVTDWSNVGAVWTIASFVYFYLLMPLLYKFITGFSRAIAAEAMFIGINIVYYMFSIEWFEPLSDLCIFGLGILVYYAQKESRESQMLLCCCAFMLLWIINLSEVSHMLFVSIIFALIIMNSNISDNVFGQAKWILSLLNLFDTFSFDIYLSHPIVLYLVGTLGIASNRYILRALFIIFGTAVLSVILGKISDLVCILLRSICYKFRC